jgi:adhesin/invasin
MHPALRSRSRALLPLSRVLVLTALAALSACSEDPDGPGDPAALQVVSGSGQTATVGTAATQPVVVKVVDADGAPVPGVAVSWVVTAGGGSVFSASVTTGEDGTASNHWTMGTTVGAQSLEARVPSGTGFLTASFDAVAHAGAAVRLDKVAGDQQTAAPGSTLADSLAVRAVDAHGNVVAGVAVTWAVTGGGGVSPAASSTGATGMAQTAYTMGTTRTANTVTASAAGAQGATFTENVRTDLVARVIVQQDTALFYTYWPARNFVAYALNAFGDTLPTAALSWTSSDTTRLAIAAVFESNKGTGVNVQPRLPGTVALTATAASGQSAAISALVTQQPPPYGVVESMNVNSTVYGTRGAVSPTQAAVRVMGTYGTPVVGVQVTWTITQGSSTVNPTSSTTDAQGIARTTVTLSPNMELGKLTATPAGGTGTVITISPYLYIAIQSPAQGATITTSTVFIMIRPSESAACTASLEGRSATFQTYMQSMNATLNLAGLAPGAKQVAITCTTSSGKTDFATLSINYAP